MSLLLQTHTIITGDIGGTNARLGLWKCSPGHQNVEVYSETYSTSTFPTFEECLQAFLDESEVRAQTVAAHGMHSPTHIPPSLPPLACPAPHAHPVVQPTGTCTAAGTAFLCTSYQSASMSSLHAFAQHILTPCLSISRLTRTYRRHITVGVLSCTLRALQVLPYLAGPVLYALQAPQCQCICTCRCEALKLRLLHWQWQVL